MSECLQLEVLKLATLDIIFADSNHHITHDMHLKALSKLHISKCHQISQQHGLMQHSGWIILHWCLDLYFSCFMIDKNLDFFFSNSIGLGLVDKGKGGSRISCWGGGHMALLLASICRYMYMLCKKKILFGEILGSHPLNPSMRQMFAQNLDKVKLLLKINMFLMRYVYKIFSYISSLIRA